MKRNFSVWQYKTEIILVLIVVMCSVMLFLHDNHSLDYPGNAGFGLISFFQKQTANLVLFVEKGLGVERDMKILRSENRELKQVLAHYRGYEKRILDLNKENEQLRELLAFKERVEYTTVACRIIAKDPEHYFSSIVINKGSSHGISKNAVAIAINDGAQGLFGKIVKVSPFTAIVKPLFDSDMYIRARLLDSRYEGLVQGPGNPYEPISLKYVAKQAFDEIQKNDLVITSGLGDIYPANIPIGRINRVEEREYDTSLFVEMRPVIDFSKLENVLVLVQADKYAE